MSTDDLDQEGGSDMNMADNGDVRVDDVLPTIVEIAGVDSSNDSLPDNFQQSHLRYPCSQLQHNMISSPNAPIGSFLKSERRARLQKAAANTDFEMKQLNQQIALTDQYTSEIIEMRREQRGLERHLKNERHEIFLRNEQLMKDLWEIDQAASQIAQAEAEVALLRGQYETELHKLGEEKVQLKHAITSAANTYKERDVSRQDNPALVDASSQSTVEEKSTSNSNSQPSDDSKKCLTSTPATYSKGSSVYYKNAATNTKVPAIILDVHLDDLLEPYYSIRMDDGHEKQTDNSHLELSNSALPPLARDDNIGRPHECSQSMEDTDTKIDTQPDSWAFWKH
eukprot:CAMPEP_0181095278 /NCGR_PEP_ID=MMETSP1071-20121207/10434_1 /TAXON_ID=35127 /ORGANISM="Thalassiosira sp., Strain NH16" /LENGTH=338 /DNA_ID=CAMNT_0023177649 /DNA_START=102 /DNA_END=1118 /DNA_ORIENTATION=-